MPVKELSWDQTVKALALLKGNEVLVETWTFDDASGHLSVRGVVKDVEVQKEDKRGPVEVGVYSFVRKGSKPGGTKWGFAVHRKDSVRIEDMEIVFDTKGVRLCVTPMDPSLSRSGIMGVLEEMTPHNP